MSAPLSIHEHYTLRLMAQVVILTRFGRTWELRDGPADQAACTALERRGLIEVSATDERDGLTYYRLSDEGWGYLR